MKGQIGVDAIILSSVDWDSAWQGHQEISLRLARLGARVLFVENTTIRGPRRGDLGRVLHRLSRWWRQRGPREDAPGLPRTLRVFSPLVAPYPWQTWSRLVNRAIFVPKVRALARDLRDPVIWAFLPSPTALDAIRACRRPGSSVVYHCAADFAQVADDPAAVRRTERELLALADVVFVVGKQLRERFVPQHPEVHVYPFGVDTHLFRPGDAAEPADLAAIPRPRAGYVGSLHRHLRIDWLAEAALRLPHVSFVLVGPRYADLGDLASLPNVHLLGRRPHEVLPPYVQAFDVCLIPYALTRYTESGIPTKLFEYLAMGRPVVASEMPEIKALGMPEATIAFAGDATEFARRIAEQLQTGPSPEAERARMNFAARYSWDNLFPAMLGHLRGLSRVAPAAS